MKSDARCVCGTVHRIQGRRRDTSVRTGSATSYRFELERKIIWENLRDALKEDWVMLHQQLSRPG